MLCTEPLEDTRIAEMRFSTKLRRVLSERGLKQKQLASELGVSESKVSDWMRGKFVPDLNELAAMSRLLEVSVDFLVLDEVTEPRREERPGDLTEEERLVLQTWAALGLSAQDAVRALAAGYRPGPGSPGRVANVEDHLRGGSTEN